MQWLPHIASKHEPAMLALLLSAMPDMGALTALLLAF